MFRPRDVAPAISRLRGGSLLTFDRLTDEQLHLPSVPGWTVADVYRHLADSDRRVVLGTHLLEFLPTRSLEAFEQHNDDHLARLRAVDRPTLRTELERWGRRLSRLVSLVPAPVARVPVVSAFGRVPAGWFGVLRLYDEWVHQWDVARAIGEPEPPMDVPLGELLAEFQLRALPGGSLDGLAADGVVEVAVHGFAGHEDGDVTPRPDGALRTWRFDLQGQRFGARVDAPPTATVTLDVAAFCLVAGNRVAWRDLVAGGRIDVDDDASGSAASVLDAVRVV